MNIFRPLLKSNMSSGYFPPTSGIVEKRFVKTPLYLSLTSPFLASGANASHTWRKVILLMFGSEDVVLNILIRLTTSFRLNDPTTF